jgi:hypothetical protein
MKKELKNYIDKRSKEITAKLRKLAEQEASRDSYKRGIHSKIYGAIGEYYKAKVAENNEIVSDTIRLYVQGWMSEYERLIKKELPGEILGVADFKRKTVAIKEVCDNIKSHDEHYRDQAFSDVVRMFGKKHNIRNGVSDKNSEFFWNEVELVVANICKKFNIK